MKLCRLKRGKVVDVVVVVVAIINNSDAIPGLSFRRALLALNERDVQWWFWAVFC